MSRFIIDSYGVIRIDSDVYRPMTISPLDESFLDYAIKPFNKLGELWDKFVITLSGKKLAVFGGREVGKTHLITFLTTGSLSTEYRQTTGAQQTPSRRFSLRELDLKVKSTLDLNGGDGAYGEWKQLHDEADIVLYLLRADRLIAGDSTVEDRVQKDVRLIGGWLEEREKRNARPDFFIIGTHCDLDPEFQSTSPETFGNYSDKFRRLQIVNKLINFAGGTQQAKVVLGSMKTVEDTELLVCRVMREAL